MPYRLGFSERLGLSGSLNRLAALRLGRHVAGPRHTALIGL